MGTAKKIKKAEKSKVKLKGHTTKFLPKGKNVTNTTFKVRKILLPTQLKSADTTQPLTQRRLSVKDILSRLQHYSSSQRQEGLTGLQQLLRQMNREQLSAHLAAIVDGLARLSLDKEKKVRRSSAQILTALFAQVGENQLSPFSATLGSYLSCAMTHIQPSIQEDSLLLLDALIQYAPSLATAAVHQLFPCALDMISRLRNETKSSRQLSVNLASNLPSIAWRARVLGRIQALLQLSLSQASTSVDTKGKQLEFHVEATQISHFPLYSPHYIEPVTLAKVFHNKSSGNSHAQFHNQVKLRDYTESIMPMLLETWVEVNPQSSKNHIKKREDSALPLEASVILYCVLEITHLLWLHISNSERENSQSDLTNWFSKTYSKDLERLIGAGFPYSAQMSTQMLTESDEESTSKGRKHPKPKSDKDDILMLQSAIPQFANQGQVTMEAVTNCVPQNLEFCYIFLNTVKDKPKSLLKDSIIEYLIACTNQWVALYSPWVDHLIRALNTVLNCSRSWAVDLDPLVNAIVQRCHHSASKHSTAHKHLAHKLEEVLVAVAVHPNLQHVLQCESYQAWLSKLTTNFSIRDLSLERLSLLSLLACHQNKEFLAGLQENILSLLSLYGEYSVASSDVAALTETRLASLLYWVPQWTEDAVAAVGKDLMEKKYVPSLAQKIINILMLRRNCSSALDDAPWWSSVSSTAH